MYYDMANLPECLKERVVFCRTCGGLHRIPYDPGIWAWKCDQCPGWQPAPLPSTVPSVPVDTGRVLAVT